MIKFPVNTRDDTPLFPPSGVSSVCTVGDVRELQAELSRLRDVDCTYDCENLEWELEKRERTHKIKALEWAVFQLTEQLKIALDKRSWPGSSKAKEVLEHLEENGRG